MESSAKKSQSEKIVELLRELLEAEHAADKARRKVRQQLRQVFRSGPPMSREEQLRFFAEYFFDGADRA
jgi:uncharacterized protein Yka (UPF0111/DUF47 family)